MAAKVATPRVRDGDANDAVWPSAKLINVALTGGVNFASGKGEVTATLEAVYSGDMIPFLVQYADPMNSIRRGTHQKQADGSWKKLKDPADKGGGDYVYYETSGR